MRSIADARRVFAALTVSLCGASMLLAQGQLLKAPTDVKPGSITYEEVEYPYPVAYLPLTLYGQDVRMAYMDIKPAGTPNGRTAVLLHGMNFGGFYFSGPIELLRKEGFRVIVPDQIGFGRSSKPIIPYNWNDLAANTRKLLQTVGVSKAVIIGHSGGGMLAARFAASYPDITERVVLYNPIGLTDSRYQRPWENADEIYKRTMAMSQDQIYTQNSATIHRYFHTPGAWKPEYEKYVRILYTPSLSADWPRLAMVRTLLGQMVLQDPVVYDWAKIKVKALVLGGAEDTPDFPQLAKHIADTIPGAELALLPGLGHVPHLQDPAAFNAALLKFLRESAPAATGTH
ncbi:MAG TPA: alpha/beta hydrolase [Bryobacteraceae bacterium]